MVVELDDKARAIELRELAKEDITPYYDTQFNFLRWIQGHPGWSTSDIAARLSHHLLMRKSSWDLDNYLKNNDRDHPVHKHWIRGITGQSTVQENVVVHIEQCCMDYEGMMANHSMTEVLKARIYDLEEWLSMVMKMEKETGKQASIVFVYDVAGMVYSKKLLDLIMNPLRGLIEFMADHYVELFKCFLVVNVPKWLHAVWMMMKPLLPERTRIKTKLLSPHHWRDEIAEYLDPNCCPEFWTDARHLDFCAQLERPTPFPPVPPPVSDLPEPLPSAQMKLAIKAGRTHWLEYDLEKGDRLSWHISASAHFGFAVLCGDFCANSDPLGTPQLHPLFPWMPGPTEVPLIDSIVIPETGKYVVWLSNSRSWWHTLIILHAITVHKAEHKEAVEGATRESDLNENGAAHDDEARVEGGNLTTIVSC